MQERASQLPLFKHLLCKGATRKGLVSNSTKLSHYSMKPNAWTSSLRQVCFMWDSSQNPIVERKSTHARVIIEKRAPGDFK